VGGTVSVAHLWLRHRRAREISCSCWRSCS
jgi:hypothetical protein